MSSAALRGQASRRQSFDLQVCDIIQRDDLPAAIIVTDDDVNPALVGAGDSWLAETLIHFRIDGCLICVAF